MKYFSISVLLFLVFFSFIFFNKQEKISQKTDLFIKGERFVADISDTNEKRQLGLSFRSGIGEREAMLFVFENADIRKFWMKDMFFPIDIIWLDSEKKIIHIERNLSPNSYPKAFGPNIESLYVVELKAGTADSLGLSLGDSVVFSI